MTRCSPRIDRVLKPTNKRCEKYDMKVAIIRDARGIKREACGTLHTPPLRLNERVPPGLWLVLLAIPPAFILSPILIVPLLPLGFVAWMLWWFLAGRQQAADRMAAQGQCPSCEYEFAGLPHGRDGLVTCPECGSGWRVGIEDGSLVIG